MSSPKVTIQMVTCNSRRLLPFSLPSILDQTYRDFQVLIIDNDSQDGTAAYVRGNFPQIAVFQNNQNCGFAKANNQGIKLFKSPYIVFCNPDIILEPTWLENLMAAVEAGAYANYGSFGGKLLKLKIIDSDSGDLEKSAIIDSCGLKLLGNHRVVELGAGEQSESFREVKEVFGQGGALSLYKREVLEKISLRDKYHPQGDYFDSSLFFYKEDVDLAWRLRLAGYQSLLLPAAVAYHLRTFAGSQLEPAGKIIKNRRQQTALAKYYSYRNHLLVMLTDEFFVNWLYYFPRIFWYELKKLFYVMIFETRNLSALGEILLLLPQIISKRKGIFSQCRVSAKDIRKWIE